MNRKLLALALCATAADPEVARLEVALETKLQEIKTACEAHDDWPVDRTLGLVTSLPSLHGFGNWSQDWWTRAVLKSQPSRDAARAKVKAEKDWLDGELRTLVLEAQSLKAQLARVKKGPSAPSKRGPSAPSTSVRRAPPRTSSQRAAAVVKRRAGWRFSLSSANEATVAETDAILACTDLPEKLVHVSASKRARFFWAPEVDRAAIIASLFEPGSDGKVSVPLFHGTSDAASNASTTGRDSVASRRRDAMRPCIAAGLARALKALRRRAFLWSTRMSGRCAGGGRLCLRPRRDGGAVLEPLEPVPRRERGHVQGRVAF